jgi:hypothetical protein
MITHIKDPNSDKCIVFIHGLGGGPNTFSKFTIYLNSKWNLDFGVLLHLFGYYRKIFYYKAPSWFPSWITNIFTNLAFPLKAFWSKRNSHNVILLGDYIKKNCSNFNLSMKIQHYTRCLITYVIFNNHMRTTFI